MGDEMGDGMGWMEIMVMCCLGVQMGFGVLVCGSVLDGERGFWVGAMKQSFIRVFDA